MTMGCKASHSKLLSSKVYRYFRQARGCNSSCPKSGKGEVVQNAKCPIFLSTKSRTVTLTVLS